MDPQTPAAASQKPGLASGPPMPRRGRLQRRTTTREMASPRADAPSAALSDRSRLAQIDQCHAQNLLAAAAVVARATATATSSRKKNVRTWSFCPYLAPIRWVSSIGDLKKTFVKFSRDSLSTLFKKMSPLHTSSEANTLSKYRGAID